MKVTHKWEAGEIESRLVLQSGGKDIVRINFLTEPSRFMNLLAEKNVWMDIYADLDNKPDSDADISELMRQWKKLIIFQTWLIVPCVYVTVESLRVILPLWEEKF